MTSCNALSGKMLFPLNEIGPTFQFCEGSRSSTVSAQTGEASTIASMKSRAAKIRIAQWCRLDDMSRWSKLPDLAQFPGDQVCAVVINIIRAARAGERG